MTYRCPVCMFTSLPYPPADYHICPCCSTEFGNDDADLSHEQLREMWVANGATWFFGQSPAHWNPWMQLIKAGFGADVQRRFRLESVEVRQANVASKPITISPLTNVNFAIQAAA